MQENLVQFLGWDPLGLGIEPVSPALAGRFFTTELYQGSPQPGFLKNHFFLLSISVLLKGILFFKGLCFVTMQENWKDLRTFS